MKILIAHAGSYDYQNELYAPLKASSLATEHTLVFPHDESNAEIATTDQIPGTGLLVAEVSYPSTGAGIEIGLVEAAGIPTLFLHKVGSSPSRSLRFCKGTSMEYTDSADLVAKVEEFVRSL